jgi:hypothetical protein
LHLQTEGVVRKSKGISLVVKTAFGLALGVPIGAWLSGGDTMPAARAASATQTLEAHVPGALSTVYVERAGEAPVCERELRQCQLGAARIAQEIEITRAEVDSEKLSVQLRNAQQRTVDDFAYRALGHLFQQERPSMLRRWREGLANERTRDRWRRGDVTRISEALDLDDEERAAFDESHAELWSNLVPEAVEALSATPPDYRKLRDVMQRSYAGEDLLARALRGQAGVKRVRSDSLQRRARLMTQLAVFAGEDPREFVSW